MKINPAIFRANSIRGIFGVDFDESLFERLGETLAGVAQSTTVVAAADHRVSSPALKEALVAGLRAAGTDVTDAGVAPKGQACFAAFSQGSPLAYVTASHLPAEWNGLKLVHAGGCTWDSRECAALYDAFRHGVSPRATGRGRLQEANAKDEYIRHLTGRLDRPAAPIKLLADHGNGTSALLLPDLLTALGFDATHRFAELDGTMPNRTSEPDESSLADIAPLMKDFDLGMAFDGDADRVVFLDPQGALIDPERFAHAILRKLTRTEPGPIVANAACGRTIEDIARRYGRKLFRTPTGMPNLVKEIRRRNACFGMERSSHCVIPAVAPWDDACAVAAFAAGAVSSAMSEGLSLAELLDEIPRRARIRRTLSLPEGKQRAFMEEAQRHWLARGIVADTLDGLRLEFDKGFVLLRASNTEPVLRAHIEADNEDGAQRLARKTLPDMESLRDRLA